jgi:hypothetical protein
MGSIADNLEFLCIFDLDGQELQEFAALMSRARESDRATDRERE